MFSKREIVVHIILQQNKLKFDIFSLISCFTYEALNIIYEALLQIEGTMKTQIFV